MKIKRNPNFELLRLLSMFFIIVNHNILNISTEWQIQQIKGLNFILTDILYQAVYVAVNCYILISGYFLVGSNKYDFNFIKVVKLWSVVFFYSVIIYLICLFPLKLLTFNVKDVVHVILPIHYDLYWFITQYIGLFLISPFLIKSANNLTKEDYKKFLIISFFIVSILQLQGLKGGFSLLWFIFLFMFSGYIRLYDPQHLIKSHPFATYITFTCILGLISILLGYSSSKLSIVSYLGFYNGPFIFISSVALFYVFKEMKPLNESNKIVKVILYFAPTCFGIYLIHEHPYLKDYLWDNVRIMTRKLSLFNILFILCFSFGLFVICAVIEKIRLFMFKISGIDNCITMISDKTILLYSNIRSIWQSH